MSTSITTYKGACHCGKVTFELKAKLDHAIYCNCSVCSKRSALWHGATDDTLKILTGKDDLELYQFGTRTAKHYFCRHCGIHPFVRPRLDPTRWAVNVRCLEGVELKDIPVRQFDGEHWEEAAKAFLRPPRG
jgi:hypothetical protein